MVEEASYLKEAGFEVIVATQEFEERPMLEDALASIGVRVRTLAPPAFLSDWPRRHYEFCRALLYRPRWLHSGDFDLARVCMPWSNRGLENIWLCNRAGIPVIVSAHNTFPGGNLQTAWHARHLVKAFSSVKGLVALTGESLDGFNKAFGNYLSTATIQRVIPNAVDTGKFVASNEARVDLRDRLGISQETRVVGSVGRLSDHKRPVELIRVFRDVASRVSGTHMVLVGEGELRREVEAEIDRSNLRGMVTLLGNQEQVERVVAGLDVHVLLSSIEGFASVNAEAMACEVPVVATDVPGSRAVVKDGLTGYLVSLGNNRTAADRVVHLLTATDVGRQMGRHGRREVLECYSVQQKKQRWLDLYRDILQLT